MAVVVLALLLPLASALVDSTDVEEEGVDIVIPSGCRADNYLLGQHIEEAYRRDVDNDQSLLFTLQSIKKNAAWARRIFVLEDPNCEVVWKAKLKRGVIPEPEKTTWLDRCDLFPHIPAAGSKDRQGLLRFRREAALLQRLDQSFPELGAYHQGPSPASLMESEHEYWHPRRTARSEPTLKGNEGPVCPTRNVFAVQTVLHHIPQLASRFVLAMPGDIAVRPTSVRTFFHGMKPRYPAGRGNLLYQNQSVAERLNAQIPRTTKSDLRVWVPLTKRLCSHIEQRYPLWLSFVRSHRKGKFSSKLDASGTPASERANSAEESLQGVWWWYLTSHPHSGIRHHGNLFEERRLGWDPGEWELLVADPGSTIVSLEDGIDSINSGQVFSRTLSQRRQLRHKLKGLITMEVDSGGQAEEPQDEAEEDDVDVEEEEAPAPAKFMRSER
ncbi:unnamed protein product [Effrenium voratum]|uniref:Uncharacterized protein n=1 Tax=Effrenium voratum TaxID=2562239 RepID=A0AA36JGY9_9DINO|nr:unnamed protein product [Effrenium voratum]